MPSSGLFITLFDKETLTLYLDRGVYGFLMPPVYGIVKSRSRHYHALADYACVREGTHVFFFLERKIIYGGQIIGSKNIGAFYINGPYSPIGKNINAPICWDESKRDRYEPTDEAGIFLVNGERRCQPYLIIFKDYLGLKGKYISSDDLYFELGKYPYPLPSNSIQGMGFCTLTPGEVDIALSLIDNSEKHFPVHSDEEIFLCETPIPFRKGYGIQNLKNAMESSAFVNEAHLEFSVIANPELLPSDLRPNENTTICRQVPVSPFKPYQMDRADICYYMGDEIADGTLPNKIIELKKEKANKGAIEQTCRYLKWLYKIAPNDAKNIEIYLVAASFSKLCRVPSEYKDQIHLKSLHDL